jgi:competence protein ComEA
MTSDKSNKFWMMLIILLAAIIIAGGIFIGTQYRPPAEIAITSPPAPEPSGYIYIGGAINNAGFYPLNAGDSLEALVQAAGGASAGADLTRLRLYVPAVEEAETPQKVNINRAEAWLLEALPGVGPARAQDIIDYRQENGQFHHINELTRIDGIGPVIFDKLKDLITVAE